jgi:hypothetical protein
MLINNANITGSLTVVGGTVLSGSLTVSGNTLNNLSASYALTASYVASVANLSTFQIASGSVSASVNVNSGSFTIANGPTPFFFVSSSGNTILSGSLAVSNLTGSGFRYIVADSAGNVTAQTASAAIKYAQAYTASAGQTTFAVTNGYTTGLVDVFINGSKLLKGTEYTDTSGTNIVLATGSFANDIVEVVTYQPASGVTNNSLRQLTSFTATAGQTTFPVSYVPGLLDVYYNGSRLNAVDYTAANGSSITLATGSAAGDLVDVLVYSYQVGAFSGIGGVGVANQVAYWNTTNSITGSTNLILSGSNTIVTGSVLISGSMKLTGTVTGPFYINSTGSGASAQLDVVHNNSQEGIAVKYFSSSAYSPMVVRDNINVVFQVNQFGRLFNTGSFMLGDPNAVEGTSVTAGTIAIFPSSSVSGGPLIQFSSNGRIRPGNTGDKLSIDGNALYLNGTFNTNVIMATGGGNVGINTTTISYKLDVQNSGGSVFGATSTGAWTTGFLNHSNFLAPNMTGGGLSVGFGKAGSTYNLAKMVYNHAGDASTSNYIGLGFWDADNLLKIQASGLVSVGSSVTSVIKLDVLGHIQLNDQQLRWRGGGDANHATTYESSTNGPFMYGYYGAALGYTASGSPVRVIWTNNTSYYNYSNTTAWSQTSDIRIKQNVNTITNALDKISLLNPVSFDYTDEFAANRNWADKHKLNNVGFIAQEYENVFPDDVNETEEKVGEQIFTDFKNINVGSLTPYLVKALQEANAKITALEEKLERNNIQ